MRMKAMLWSLVVAALLAAPGVSHATGRGYEARACGFDLDRDGRRGEDGTQKFCQSGEWVDEQCSTSADCDGATCSNTGSTTNVDCNICDGTGSEVGDEIYVDCSSGNDTTGTGAPGAPYKTMVKAFQVVDAQDGDTTQDVVCLRGTCASYNNSPVNNLSHNLTGVAGVTTLPARGDDAFAMQVGTKPIIVAAWDQDGDHSYAPFDIEAKPPVVDACSVSGGCSAGNGAGRTCSTNADCTSPYSGFCNNATNECHPLRVAFTSNGTDRIEVAHLTFKNYGEGCPFGTSCSVWVMNSVSGTHNELHDNVFSHSGANGAMGGDTSSQGTVRIFNTTGNYFLAENNYFQQQWQYPLRSAGANSSFMRWKNNLFEPYTNNDTAPFRFWLWSKVDLQRNKFDNSASSASASIQGGELSIAESNLGVWVTNNEFIDYPTIMATPWMVHGGSALNTDPADGLYVRKNLVRFTKAHTSTAVYGRIMKLTAGATDGIERTDCASCSTGCSGCLSSSGSCVLTSIFGGNSNCTCSNGANGHGGGRDLFIENNVFDCRGWTSSGTNRARFMSVLEYQNGNNCGSSETFGPLYFQQNSIIDCWSSTSWSPGSWNSIRAALVIGAATDDPMDFRYTSGDVRINGNIIDAGSNYALVNVKRGDDGLGPVSGTPYYDPGVDLFADYNVYPGTPKFYSEGVTSTGLSSYQSTSGQESHSRNCSPSYTSTSSYTLSTGDTCALNRGSATVCTGTGCGTNADCLATDPDEDIDSTQRPQNVLCDIGASEVTTSDPCTGECTTSADCSDGNSCTTDSCSGCPLTCSHANNTISCTDSVFCNGTDTCSGGSCSVHSGDPCSGSPTTPQCSESTDTCVANDACDTNADCAESPNNVCTTDVCNNPTSITSTCSNNNNTASCSDGLYCNGNDTCSGGGCSAHAGNPCGVNQTCNEATDTCITDECDANGECEDTNPCTTGICNNAANPDSTCSLINNTASCSDGLFCNGADVCFGGSCSAHAGDPCGDNASCQEATDTCVTDECDADADCTDGNTCTTDVCNNSATLSSTCSHSNNAASCSDGIFCNGADTCTLGACTIHAGDPCAVGLTCNEASDTCTGNCTTNADCTETPDEPCTTDTCSGSLCSRVNNALACDDSTYCNGTDTCSGGTCATHSGDPCTGNDSCEEWGDFCGDLSPRIDGDNTVSFCSQTAVSAYSAQVTVGSQADRALVVFVVVRGTTFTTAADLSTVTVSYGGDSMALVDNAFAGPTIDPGQQQLKSGTFYLNAPVSGTNTLAIDFGRTVSSFYVVAVPIYSAGQARLPNIDEEGWDSAVTATQSEGTSWVADIAFSTAPGHNEALTLVLTSIGGIMPLSASGTEAQTLVPRTTCGPVDLTSIVASEQRETIGARDINITSTVPTQASPWLFVAFELSTSYPGTTTTLGPTTTTTLPTGPGGAIVNMNCRCRVQ